jgi:hypothetical protein
MKLEALVQILDVFAFILVTPELMGEGRLCSIRRRINPLTKFAGTRWRTLHAWQSAWRSSNGITPPPPKDVFMWCVVGFVVATPLIWIFDYRDYWWITKPVLTFLFPVMLSLIGVILEVILFFVIWSVAAVLEQVAVRWLAFLIGASTFLGARALLFIESQWGGL